MIIISCPVRLLKGLFVSLQEEKACKLTRKDSLFFKMNTYWLSFFSDSACSDSSASDWMRLFQRGRDVPELQVLSLLAGEFVDLVDHLIVGALHLVEDAQADESADGSADQNAGDRAPG